MTIITKLLIANRGEIAVRVMRTARQMGIATVAVYSEADKGAVHMASADEAVCIGGAAPAESYLRVDAIIEAARATGADAIHPGYGFLAENPALPAACADAGIIFVGPSADAIADMGDKAAAKRLMEEAGVPCVPGYDGADQTPATLLAKAKEIGFPIMIKATAGGGGRGMRLVNAEADFEASLVSAVSEAKSAFGDGTVLLERAIVNPRHVEIQIMADSHGNAIHLGERDCSVQRRHQKLIEEAPSPAVDASLRARMGEASVKAALAIGYEGAGTFEYLLDSDGQFYFMEMNTRLQVEHPVTEAVTGLDLVELQLRIAAGEALPLGQVDVTISGHAVEVRLCAEDPDEGFMPQSGRLARWKPADTIRADHALRDGADIPPFYDSMIAKLIAYGPDRDAALRKLIAGLGETQALGVRTNQGFLGDCLRHPVFAAGKATTAFIADHGAELMPDRENEDRAMAGLAGALMRAADGTSLAHGFAAPLRLACGERVFSPRIVAHGGGRCDIHDGGEIRSIKVTGRDGDSIRFEDGARSRKAGLVLSGSVAWLYLNGRSYDFTDLTFAPEVTADAAGDGKVRASMNGTVVSVAVKAGDIVTKGQTVLV
ncbi:MAG: acetyl-CoA carboxylase biotin carboxylase subunit, partial [Rhizobiaceae bacterium]|nr:acetyl-CoA carboxylase biotin carboxylase subunit [Rhizobiaceae bacterium]